MQGASAKNNPNTSGNGRHSSAFRRSTFTTDRTMEFFKAEELTMQIGHPRESWALALLKELSDNALDACETAGVAPAVIVKLEDDALSVRDNGAGIPEETIRRSLHYGVRVSDKTGYVSPSRGQLGNALKCVWAAPFVAGGGKAAAVEVSARGLRHLIEVSLDRIAQRPQLKLTTTPCPIKKGTLFRLHWPKVARCKPEGEGLSFYAARGLMDSYAAFNPHAALLLRYGTDWVWWGSLHADGPKWKPYTPTSRHWYTPERFCSLIAAMIAEERGGGTARTVRQFIGEFSRLSGVQKQKAVFENADLPGDRLADLVKGDDVDREAAGRLLEAMRRESRPVNPKALGVVGRDNLAGVFTASGGCDEESIRYKRLLGGPDDSPFVLEVAFGVRRDQGRRRLLCGVNWSPALRRPFEQLDCLLDENRINEHDPVVMAIHLAAPRVEYTDRGKSRLALSHEAAVALESCIRLVGKDWKEAKGRADRENRIRQQDLERLRKADRRKKLTIKGAAVRALPDAYEQASGGGAMPAEARQIMYANRRRALDLTGGRWFKKSSTFTQKVLPEFVNAHPELTEKWDVVYGPRGHLAEPHTGVEIELGTVQVRNYVFSWADRIEGAAVPPPSVGYSFPTTGPTGRYRFGLFVEKEGFGPLLAHAAIASRYDLAIMSTKGMSVTAARTLVERLSEKGVTILVLRDMDKSGFSIVYTLANDGPRFKFRTRPKVIDLGLRLEDIRALSLEGEPVFYTSKVDPRKNLRERGATEEECAFLVRGGRSGDWHGRRVELNELTSPQWVAFLEGKLKAAGVGKVVPDAGVLADAWKRAMQITRVQKAIDAAMKADPARETIPADLGLGWRTC
jgi:DNA topoisomerase VI subunit B